MIVAICKSRGFDAMQARCGDEALKVYRKYGPFVLVLSDLYWYDGSGIEPPVSDTKTIRHGIQLALAIRKLALAQNIVIHTAAFKCAGADAQGTWRHSHSGETVRKGRIGVVIVRG